MTWAASWRERCTAVRSAALILAGAKAAEALAGVEPGAEAEAGTGGELTPTTSAGEAVAEAEASAGVDSAATASEASAQAEAMAS